MSCMVRRLWPFALLPGALLGDASLDGSPVEFSVPPERPLQVKAVIITFWCVPTEVGPGDEFDSWVERLPLPDVVQWPAACDASGRPDCLRWNSGLSTLGVCTGAGKVTAAAALSSLLHHPRLQFDGNTLWLSAGVAGADPRAASLGSAVWTSVAVDGERAFFLDSREMPQNWPIGWVPLSRKRPYGAPRPSQQEAAKFRVALKPPPADGLLERAFRRSLSVSLGDSVKLQALRKPWASFGANATAAPFVTMGASLATDSYWCGEMPLQHARRWVDYWTGEYFAASAMEDTALISALRLSPHPIRLLILRTISDYVTPPAGHDCNWMLFNGTAAEDREALNFALNTAFVVGRAVLLGELNDQLVHTEVLL